MNLGESKYHIKKKKKYFASHWNTMSLRRAQQIWNTQQLSSAFQRRGRGYASFLMDMQETCEDDVSKFGPDIRVIKFLMETLKDLFDHARDISTLG